MRTWVRVRMPESPAVSSASALRASFTAWRPSWVTILRFAPDQGSAGWSLGVTWISITWASPSAIFTASRSARRALGEKSIATRIRS